MSEISTIPQAAAQAVRNGGYVLSCPIPNSRDEYKICVFTSEDALVCSATVVYDLVVRTVRSIGAASAANKRQQDRGRHQRTRQRRFNQARPVFEKGVSGEASEGAGWA